MNINQAIGWGLFAAVSYYIPFRAYADRVICKSKIADSAFPPLLISYIIWYVPIVMLLIGAILFEEFIFCSSVALAAILWAYLGHKWVKSQSGETDPN
jgi:hypothetical protein